MLLALQNAITSLLRQALPALFDGESAVKVEFSSDSWTFDRMSADPTAGEPGPEDAVDRLAFDPAAPTGPYALTRPPYPGPKRVYLRSAQNDLIALSPSELTWNPANPSSFTFQPRPGRELTEFDQLEVLYSIVAAGSRLKLLHQATLTLTAADEAGATRAVSLALAVLALNRDALRQSAGFSDNSGNYQIAASLTTLAFASGTAAASTATLLLTAEMDLCVERLLGDDEGTPIARILSPGRPVGSRRVDVDPMVQA